MAETRSKGWWLPLIFLGFFLVVVTVNVTMAYFATSTFTGLTTQHAYEKGVEYNRNLEMAKAQEALGWTVTTTVTPLSGPHPAAHVAITYLDRDGKPIQGLEVAALVSRPTVVGYDHEVTLAPAQAGTYTADLTLPMAGEWDIDVMATAKDKAYQLQRRFILP